jgi:hypothetical protein
MFNRIPIKAYYKMSQRWTHNLLELELFIRTVYSGTGLCREFIFYDLSIALFLIYLFQTLF